MNSPVRCFLNGVCVGEGMFEGERVRFDVTTCVGILLSVTNDVTTPTAMDCEKSVVGLDIGDNVYIRNGVG